MPSPQAPRPLRVMVYSDDRTVRRTVITALGTRPDPELPELEFVEVATGPVVLRTADAGGLDLLILDGEATPAGGLGIARQLKDEIHRCPPILVITGRPAGCLAGHLVTCRRRGGPPDRARRARRGGLGPPAGPHRRSDYAPVTEQLLTDWVDVLESLLAGEELSAPTTTWVMAEMLTGVLRRPTPRPSWWPCAPRARRPTRCPAWSPA